MSVQLKYKIGDRVRVTTDTGAYGFRNKTGTIKVLDSRDGETYQYRVKLDTGADTVWFAEHELSLVNQHKVGDNVMARLGDNVYRGVVVRIDEADTVRPYQIKTTDDSPYKDAILWYEANRVTAVPETPRYSYAVGDVVRIKSVHPDASARVKATLNRVGKITVITSSTAPDAYPYTVEVNTNDGPRSYWFGDSHLEPIISNPNTAPKADTGIDIIKAKYVALINAGRDDEAMIVAEMLNEAGVGFRIHTVTTRNVEFF